MRFILAIVAALALTSAADARGGHYVGGHGSSHKGGHYVNRATGNHYRHHRH